MTEDHQTEVAVDAGGEQDTLHNQDKQLIQALVSRERTRAERNPAIQVGGWTFRNSTLSVKINTLSRELSAPPQDLPSEGLEAIKLHLEEHGIISLPITRVELAGESRPIMDATPAKTGDAQMSKNLWIRDQAQATSSLLETWYYNPEKSEEDKQLAQELLSSTLDLMSSKSQLDRFAHIVEHPEDKTDQTKWPHIYLGLDNLDGQRPERWKHIQDAWQMLGYTTFDALDKGLITGDNLKQPQKDFLASIVPFLAAIDFTTNENSGSWEEQPVRRTSAIGIETALLAKLKTYAQKDEFSFLKEGFDKKRDTLQKGNRYTDPDFTQTLNQMVNDGLHTLADRLPFESPDYDPTSPQYRQADAALLYLLDCNIPQLLIDNKVIPKKLMREVSETDTQLVKKIEEMILKQIKSLEDNRTNGIKRYGGTDKEMRDTYLGTNYGTNEIQHKRDEMYKTTSDYTERFVKRDEIVPQGPAAAWTHPVAKLTAWSFRRYLETKDNSYYHRGMEYYLRSLSLITGKDEHNAVLDENRQYKENEVAENLLPECWVTYQDEEGEMFVVPSPNTPLNWATMELRKAASLSVASIKRKEKDQQSKMLVKAAA